MPATLTSFPSGTRRPHLALIAAVARRGVIGRDGSLVWRDPLDAKHFRQTTLGCPVIMGRKTWESLPERFRPLPGRLNVVVTRQARWQAEGATSVASLADALALMPVASAEKVFVIGGGQLYAEALPRADSMVLTEVDAEFPGDVVFPAWSRQDFVQQNRAEHLDAQGHPFAFVTYLRVGAQSNV
jgi:dihydrofolate reductase